MIYLNWCSIFLFFLLIVKIYNLSLEELKTYRCRNGEYISNELVCNGIDDCGDRSDELNICDTPCGAGKFLCANLGFCKDITDYCNTIKDCTDGSDEKNCGNETEVSDCQFHKGKFLCKDGLKCLDLEYTCDGHCNCFDCSDENNNCSKIVDSTCNACPQHCFTTPYGPRCFCDSRDKKLHNLCKKVEDCSSDPKYNCPQTCSRYNKKTACSCFKNYKEITNSRNSWCQSRESNGDSLIYTTPTRIKALNLTTKRIDVIEDRVECAILTAAHDHVFYTKYRDDNRKIYKTSISAKQTTEVLYWYSPITSIGIDYITNNLYFSTETSVMVCPHEQKKNSCKRVVCCDANFVALAPRFGIMFYTRRIPRGNKKYIFKSNMDGTEENIVIDGVFEDIVSLTVDESTERVYWLEKQKNKIHSVPFSISEFNTQIKSTEHGGDNSTSSVTVFQKKVLFVKNHGNMIASMENFQDFNLFFADLSTLSIELLYAYNPFLQRNNQVVNPCAGTLCLAEKNLCLLRSSSSLGDLEYNCTQSEN